MVKLICDRCGCDCGNAGYDVLVRSIHNPHPHHYDDHMDPSITDEPFGRVRLLLCQKCYRDEFKLPSIIESESAGRIVWRDEPNTKWEANDA